MKFEVGQTASVTQRIDEEHVRRFAALMGDDNPVHLDAAFAARTRFGKPIAHGNLAHALVTRILGTKLPGPGTIYLGQTLKFLAPVYFGDVLTAEVKVVAVRADKPILTLETTCRKEDGAEVLRGEAVVLFEEPRSA